MRFTIPELVISKSLYNLTFKIPLIFREDGRFPRTKGDPLPRDSLLRPFSNVSVSIAHQCDRTIRLLNSTDSNGSTFLMPVGEAFFDLLAKNSQNSAFLSAQIFNFLRRNAGLVVTFTTRGDRKMLVCKYNKQSILFHPSKSLTYNHGSNPRSLTFRKRRSHYLLLRQCH